uniref:Reverse transcriptase Ty1/copia-type domain-containing protein n=1 Tax=Fagus sylvatica TaxID=28930 RepID=A0A2N9HLT2_FAGSY
MPDVIIVAMKRSIHHIGGGLVPRPVIAEDSGSDLQPSGSITLDQDSQARRVSSRGHIPRRHFEIEGNVLLCDAKDVDEPASFSEALHSPDRDEWMTAMQEEMSSMDKNNVWELVDLPPGRKTIGNKWVLKVKRKADGSIDRYKARLVAKGYTQREGIDYEDTFSPVVRFASIRLILSIVAKQDLELFQMDVKTAFLNGELDEEIYMAQPAAGNDMDSIVTTKKWLSSTFEMKDMGEANFVLGVKITRDRSKKLLSLSQGTYIKKILERFHMHNSKPIDTPMEKGCTLSLDQCPKNDEEKNQMSKVPYASAIGSLMYAMLCTRPDICFAVGMVSRYQSNPGPAHWRAVKRILRDADWASDKDERKSTSGYAFILGGGAVSWCSVTAHAEDAVLLYSDSTSALAYAKDPKYHGKAKHIELRYHYIRDMVSQGEVILQHISTRHLESDWAKNSVDLSPGRKTIGNKWVLKVKCKADGSIDRYKARLVAKGYTQREGIDYEDTFSPVTAFLNGELDEEIYMAQPAGFEVKGHEHKVCHLKRSIYGLKQSSRQWYLRFHDSITSFGFEMIEEDHCVYLKRSKRSILILSLYVDDILLAENDMDSIVTTKKWLSSTFEMKDMGEANFVLGVKITRDRSKKLLSLSQETYIKKILELSMVSRYQSNPGPAHWRVVKRILWYLCGTSDHALCYHGGDLRLTGYSDADWASDKDECKSTLGYAFILGGGAVSWCSKKQSCIALSTMESEYVTCSAAIQEAVWLRRFLQRLAPPLIEITAT